VDERRLQALTSQIEALSSQYDARLKKLEDDSRVRRKGIHRRVEFSQGFID
jgi:hypothetical protein